MNAEDREKLVREIARTSESIRKKHRALKSGRMEEKLSLQKHFQPVIQPLEKLVEKIDVGAKANDVTKIKLTKEEEPSNVKFLFPKRVRDMNDDGATPKHNVKRRKVRLQAMSMTPSPITPIDRAVPNTSISEDVFETDHSTPLETSIRQTLQTTEGRAMLHQHLGPLGQEYVGNLLSGDRNSKNDHVYGVYVSENGTMLGNKQFDVDTDDTIIIDGTRYAGTPGLYELIFKRIPDDTLYTETDKQKYRSILLTTNAHRRNHSALLPILGNKGYKYKHVIAPLVSLETNGSKQSGAGLPRAVTITNNAIDLPRAATVTNNTIDYIHWNDPNELVERLQLLDASRQAGNNAHDNEILSILEELREAGIIIN